MSNIYGFIPFSHERNLGKAYNLYCNLVPNSDDWIYLKDADAMFLTPDYETQLKQLITKYPQTGMFTCLNNRAGAKLQVYKGAVSGDGEIRNHKKIAQLCQREKRLECVQLKQAASGYFMLFKKSTWEKCKFDETNTKLLGVDTKFSQDLFKRGFDIKVALGVYVFHYYRLLEGVNYKNHLLK